MTTLPNGCYCSKLAVYPKNWKQVNASTKKNWYIWYRFYDPTILDDEGRVNYKEILIALTGGIIVFLLLAGVIILFLFSYLKRRFLYRQELAELKLKSEKNCLKRNLKPRKKPSAK